jgi:hypothetical protein
LALIALFGLLAVTGAALADPSDNLKACFEAASHCRQQCHKRASCERVCQKSFRQCGLAAENGRPDYPRDSVMPR